MSLFGQFPRMTGLAVLAGVLGLLRFGLGPTPGLSLFPTDEAFHVDVSPEMQADLALVRSIAEGNRDGMLLDVRSEAEYLRGHIPFADLLPKEELEPERGMPELLRFVSTDFLLVFYCGGGSCKDSKHAAEQAQALGFSNTRVFVGGWHEWTAAGLSVEEGRP